MSIETCDLKGANRTVVLPAANVGPQDFCWLLEGPMLYSRTDSPGSNDSNLWEIGVNARKGAPTDKPKRITRWAGSYLWGLSASADGKRLAVLKRTYQPEVYVGELTAGGTRMKPPRRLTDDEANDAPTAWTPDSKAVLFQSDRNGALGIFRQVISQDAAEPVVLGSQSAGNPRLNGDAAWIPYREGGLVGDPGEALSTQPSTPVALLRTYDDEYTDLGIKLGVPAIILLTAHRRGVSSSAGA